MERQNAVIESTPDPLHPRYVGIAGVIRDREANGEDGYADVHHPQVARKDYNVRSEPRMTQGNLSAMFSEQQPGEVQRVIKTHWVLTGHTFRKDDCNNARGACLVCGLTAEFFRDALSCSFTDENGVVIPPRPLPPLKWPSGRPVTTSWITPACMWLKDGKPSKPVGNCIYCAGGKLKALGYTDLQAFLVAHPCVRPAVAAAVASADKAAEALYAPVQ